jgi:hypothetical protein
MLWRRLVQKPNKASGEVMKRYCIPCIIPVLKRTRHLFLGVNHLPCILSTRDIIRYVFLSIPDQHSLCVYFFLVHL